MQGMTGANDKIRLVMTIVPKGIYLGHSCKYILLPPNIDIHFALGFYNSKLVNWFSNVLVLTVMLMDMRSSLYHFLRYIIMTKNKSRIL